MVLIEGPLVGIEAVDEGNDGGGIDAVIAQQVTRVGPVFLFDMSVVIFLVRPGASEIHGAVSIGKIADEMVVEELGAVITIEGQQWKGQRVFNVRHFFEDITRAFVPHGTAFGPGGMDIGHDKAPGEIARKAVAAVSDSIGFHETRAGDVPVVGTDRDLVAKH